MKKSISPIALIAIVVIAGSVITILNIAVNTTNTTVTKSQATMLQPKLTERYGDNFKTSAINADKWAVGKTGTDVTAGQTETNNLRIDIPAGKDTDKAKAASLTFKQLMKDNGDFRFIVTVYKPLTTGAGPGVSGIRFSSKGSNSDEGAAVRWVVNGDASTISYSVASPDGTTIEKKSVPVKSTIALLRLERINKTYRASYKVGNNMDDNNWTILGEESNQSLGADGYVALFASDGGDKNKHPKVVARFDGAYLAWEGKPAPSPTTNNFTDTFGSGSIGPKWKASATAGTAVIETNSDNLTMNVSAGGISNKARAGWVVRTQPIIGNDKSFAINAVIYKPIVKGDGQGATSLSFQSTGSLDDESAAIHWVVSEKDKTSKLVFAVRAPDGTLSGERASTDIKDLKANRLTVRLARRKMGNISKYTAFYRIGDADQDWVAIGNEADGNLGGDGHIVLSTSNMGASKKFPGVVGRFDAVTAMIDK